MEIANTNRERMSNLMKKRSIFMKLSCVCLAVATTLMLGTALVSARNDTIITPVSVHLDGLAVFDGESGEKALLVDAVTYVPLRRFCTLMGGGEVNWDADNRMATVRATGLDISVTEGESYIMVNERVFYCQSPNLIIGGSLYVPVRVISKAYGLDVAWCASKEGGLGYVELTSGGSRAEDASDVYDAEVLYWLSRIISAESRGESLTGQIAVGNVVLNRTRDANFPDTVYDVIFDTKYGVQFTPVSNGTIYDEPTQSSIIAAKICLEGYTLSDDILYFLNEAISTNMWVSNNRTYIMTLGNHAFYS